VIPVKHLSASSAKAYILCPRQWQYRYIDRLPDPPGPAMEHGTMVHQAIERYWRGGYDKPEPGLHRYVSTYRKMPGAVTPERVGQVELKLQAALPGVDVPILGYLDLVTTDGVIVDLKTAGRHWPSERALTELQPALYTWLATQCGYEIERFEFHILVGDGSDRQVLAQCLPVVLDEEEVERHLESVRSAWRGIVAGVFPPRRTVLCGWCGFREVCQRRIGAGESIETSESLRAKGETL
jgi:putative RecB family exonuclease